jgi:hypothetical protein
MSSTLLALGALALSSPALAADERPAHEFHLVTGSYGTGDRHFEIYSPLSSIGASGARLGIGLKGPWSIMTGYTRRSVVSEYFDSMVGSNPTEIERDEAALITSFTGQQVTFGPKLQIDPKPWLGTYVTAQGLMFMGSSRLDDDPTTDENPNQLKSFGWAPGFVAAAGIEVNPQIKASPVQLSSFLEMGYNWTAAFELSDENIDKYGTNEPASMGELSFRGYYMQAGIGIKF